jgi:hypothetical protein
MKYEYRDDLDFLQSSITFAKENKAGDLELNISPINLNPRKILIPDLVARSN